MMEGSFRASRSCESAWGPMSAALELHLKVAGRVVPVAVPEELVVVGGLLAVLVVVVVTGGGGVVVAVPGRHWE